MNSSPKWPVLCVEWDVKRSLTHGMRKMKKRNFLDECLRCVVKMRSCLFNGRTELDLVVTEFQHTSAAKKETVVMSAMYVRTQRRLDDCCTLIQWLDKHLDLIWTVICWSWGRGILTELSLCYRYWVVFQQYTLHNHNEQFFQVGLLDRALISLGLALSPPSISVSSDFMVLCKFFLNYTYFTLPCMAWSGGIGPLPGGLTHLLSFSDWHCWLGHLARKIVPYITYNVFGGTLNPTLLYWQTFYENAINQPSTFRKKWFTIPTMYGVYAIQTAFIFIHSFICLQL